MVKATTPQGVTTFAYDPGRRIAKHSPRGKTLFGWDGDVLAFESSDKRGVHYVHEAGSFVPLAQATRQGPIALTASVGAKDLMDAKGRYDISRDPLWNGEAERPTGPGFTKEEIAFYQIDHLGTPQELTDHEGNVAWAAQYKAWGQAREVISEAARKAGIGNPIRFQGQYLDEETGLHYNRYRYYDPRSGRFVSSDPIGLGGDTNLHRYAPNPTQWVDPLGLAPQRSARPSTGHAQRRTRCGSSRYQGKDVQGFKNGGEIQERLGNLRNRLKALGINDAVVGIRGSAVTNVSSKGGGFRHEGCNGGKPSDIDFFVSSPTLDKMLAGNFQGEGVIKPDSVKSISPELNKVFEDFSSQTSTQLGRKASVGILRTPPRVRIRVAPIGPEL